MNYSRSQIIKKRKYRKNIKGSKLSLYISNYPIIVKYLAKRIGNKNKVLAELCCGIGVTLEYIGSSFKKLIGIDINKKILNQCAENLKQTKLLKKTTLIQENINNISTLKKIKADIVIYDIPYWSNHKKNLKKKNPNLKTIIKKIKTHITKNILILCPPTYKYKTVRKQLGKCEFQEVYINNKHDRNHIYLGKLIKKQGITILSISKHQ